MDLLTIQHEDFTMYVECTKFDAIFKTKGMIKDTFVDTTFENQESLYYG